MLLTRIHPVADAPVDLTAETARDALVELYRPPSDEWVRLNLVMSVSGSAAGSDGTSETLTSATDRTLLGVIRQLADVVLVGAASVRAEGYQLPRRAALAIVTSSGDLAGHRIDVRPGSRVIVLCPESARQRVADGIPSAEVLVVADDDGQLDMADLVRTLREAGLRSIVCEGGPHLAAQLVTASLLDELCLTTSPSLTDVRLAAFGRTPFPEVPLKLAQLLVDESSSLYARWLTPRGAARLE